MHSTNLWPILLLAATGAFAAPLDCGPATHDAGIVAQGRELVSDVVCRNVSDRPAEIGELATGCPCLSATANSTGEVAPGAAVHVRLRLATDGLTDRVGFPVEMTVRQGAAPVTLFHYEADIRPSVVAYPEYVDLGDWKKGGERTLLLVDTTGAPFGIEHAVAARGTVDVRWVQVGLLRVDDHWAVASGKGAVSGYQVTIQPRPPSKDCRRSLSDEVQLDLRHGIQHSVRIRIVGFSP